MCDHSSTEHEVSGECLSKLTMRPRGATLSTMTTTSWQVDGQYYETCSGQYAPFNWRSA